MKQGNSYLEKYILSWECFCKYSFKQPDIFNVLFLKNLGDTPENLLKRYYSIYSKDLIGVPDEIKHLLLEPNL